MFSQDLDGRVKKVRFVVHGVAFAVTLAVTALVYGALILPLDRRMDAKRRQAEEFAAGIEEAGALQARQAKLTEELASLEARSRAAAGRMPEEPLEGEVLHQLKRIADSAGLRIRGYRPAAVRTGEGYSQVEIQVEAVASYRSFCRFLDGLAGVPRICRVIQLDVAGTSQADGYPMNFTLAVFFKLTPPGTALAQAGSPPGPREEHSHGARQ